VPVLSLPKCLPPQVAGPADCAMTMNPFREFVYAR